MHFNRAASLQLWIDEYLRAAQVKSWIYPRLPELPRKAKGDPDLLRRIVINPLSSTVKFSPTGSEVKATFERDAADAIRDVEPARSQALAAILATLRLDSTVAP